jgi:hypothetical protein
VVLVKLILDEDGVKVLNHAWANPDGNHKPGDLDGNGYTYFDVSNEVDDPRTQSIDVPDGFTKLIDGKLVVDADYTPPKLPVFTYRPTEQDQVNAELLKTTAQLQLDNAALLKAIATIKTGGES